MEPPDDEKLRVGQEFKDFTSTKLRLLACVERPLGVGIAFAIFWISEPHSYGFKVLVRIGIKELERKEHPTSERVLLAKRSVGLEAILMKNLTFATAIYIFSQERRLPIAQLDHRLLLGHNFWDLWDLGSASDSCISDDLASVFRHRCSVRVPSSCAPSRY